MAKCSRCGRNIPGFSWKKVCSWCVQHEAQQRGELPDDAMQKVMPTPWSQSGLGSGPNLVTQLLLIVNVMVFVAMVMAGGSISDPSPKLLMQWGANLAPLTLSNEWWRLITYMFLHGGIIHIGLNMWCLWSIGGLAESLYGHETFLLVYLLSGVGGGVASAWWNPNAFSVGASGAIFGIAGALIASLKLGEFSLPSGMISGYLRSLLLFAGYSVIFGVVGGGGIDNAAHMGGFLIGVVMGALIAKVAPGRDQSIARLGVLLIGAALVVGSGLWLKQSRSYILHYQNAIALASQRKFDEAIPELQRATRSRRDFPEAHLMLAYLYQNKSDLAKAEEEYKQVLSRHPKDESALYGLGSLYFAQKRHPEAKAAFTQLLQVNPQNAEAHYGMGQLAALGEGDCDMAIREYKRAAELDSEVGSAVGLAQCYAKQKNYDEAIAVLGREREQYDSAELELTLADVYRAKGMLKEADTAAKKAEELRKQER